VSSLDGDGYFGFQAEAGVTYQIAVSSLSGAEGNIVLSLQFLTPPLNDNFAARQTLTGAPVKFVAWNADASNEPGEPQHWSPAAGRSVWCSWAAPSTGSLMLKATAYQGTPPILAIYRGTAVSSLQRLAASADPGGVVCDVIAGSTYLIAIDRQAQEGSTFVCELSLSTVSISSPASGTIFQAPANIIVEARTTSYDGNVSRVDFFAGAQLLGATMNQPYRVLWQNPPAPGRGDSPSR